MTFALISSVFNDENGPLILGGFIGLHPGLGYQDIKFAGHPGFSKPFVIKGEDETTTREFLSRKRQDFYASATENESEYMMISPSLTPLSPRL